MSEELKPCPFCGCESERLEMKTRDDGFYFVYCPCCGAQSAAVINKETATSSWNWRIQENDDETDQGITD